MAMVKNVANWNPSKSEAGQEGVGGLAARQREVDVQLRQQLVARKAHLAIGVGALLGQPAQIEPALERDRRGPLGDRSASVFGPRNRALDLERRVVVAAHQEAQRVARVLDGRLRVEQLNLGLRDQLLRAQHVELRHQAGIELRFGRVAQPARPIDALPRHVDERLLRDDAVVGGDDVDGDLLLGDRLLAIRVLRGAARRSSRRAARRCGRSRAAAAGVRVSVVSAL